MTGRRFGGPRTQGRTDITHDDWSTVLDNVRRAAERPRVLVAEDDSELRELLTRLLTDAGYAAEAVGDGQAALHRALTHSYQALVIDRGMPGIDGLDLVTRLRRTGVHTPVLILTAYGALADRVAGLDAGAEDYMVKPFEVDELLARLRALLRRHVGYAESLRIGRITLDLTTRIAVRADGTEVELSGREAALLRALVSRPTRVFSRDELRAQVFDEAESDSIVDTYVHYLRRKLGNNIIKTVRGFGYRSGHP
jgi:two-component system response regulator QseB